RHPVGGLRGAARHPRAARGCRESDQHALRRRRGRGRDPRPRTARRARGQAPMIWTALVILVVLLALAIPVAAALGFLGIALSALYSKLPLTLAIGEMAWATS